MQKIRLYRSVRLRALFLLLTVLLAGMIFYMSSETATESGERSHSIVATVIRVFCPEFDSLSSAAQTELLASGDHILRKCTHFATYALLGGLVCLSSLGFFASPAAHLCRSLFLSALYAASDEIHQSFVPGRGPALTDVLLDSAGALCGILFILLAAALLLKKQTKKS